MAKILAQGAEAKIIQKGDKVIKNRIAKSYRLKELDERIRKLRTRSETKLLLKASKIINVPVPEISKYFDKIIIPYIKGKKLSENLDKLNNRAKIARLIGEVIGKLHDEDIIHGDLTTSNMILIKDKIFFIDFGLGYISRKYEDKAVDLHLLKQALEAKHYKFYTELWNAVEQGYKKSKHSKVTLERLKAVEKRGRYKDKY